MNESISNPDYETAEYGIAIMTKDGCYDYHKGKWFRFLGYDFDDSVQSAWQEVPESEVPESFKQSIRPPTQL